MRSLRGYLAAMSTLLVALVLAGTAFVVWRLDTFGRSQTENQLLATTRAMSLAVDGQLGAYEVLVRSLRETEAFQRGDWKAVDAQARRLLAGPDAWVVVGNRDRRQLVNTRLAPTAALPAGGSAESMWRELDTGRSRVCNFSHGYVERDILCVDAPSMRSGRAVFHISVIFKPRLLQGVMDAQQIGNRRFLAVLDRDGTVLWRNLSPERFVGKPGGPDVLAALRQAPEGVMRSVSLDGVPTLLAYSRSPYSGWTFIVAMPRRELAASAEQALRAGGIVALMMVAIGVAVGLVAARRVVGAVSQLSAAAERIQQGRPPAFRPSGLIEIDRLGADLTDAIAARDATQERFNLAQEAGGIGSWEWDVPNDRGYGSEAYRRMHGLSDLDRPLRLADLLAVVHPDDLEAYKAGLATAFRSKAVSTSEYRVLLPDGLVRSISAKGRPLFDEDGRIVGAIGIVIDLTESKAAEDRLHLLMREVDHRANNLMAVVQSAVSLSRANTADDLRQIILGRVEALARAHQLLAKSRWTGADLRRLAEEELAPYTLGDTQRALIEGPSLILSPALAQGVAMTLHELATNAAKHGALSVPGGLVHLQWTTTQGMLRLRWTESGGPAVRDPLTRGFGTMVLQRALSGSIGGVTRVTWRAEGLICDVEAPLQPADAEGDEASF